MSRLTHRGFTLVELLVALVLLGIVTTGIYRVLVNNQRMYQAQTQRIDLQQNIRAAATILPAEFREMNSFAGDISAMAPTSITIRAMREESFICSAPITGLAIPLNAQTLIVRGTGPGTVPLFSGVRNFDATTDSLLIQYEGDEGSRLDDSWVPARLTAVVPAVCPDGSSGERLTFNWNLGGLGTGTINAPNVIYRGAPVRGFEPVTYQVYQSGTDAQWYLGMSSRTSGGTVQPLIGPLIGGAGIGLRYFNANGAITAQRDSVAVIEFTLRARTAQPVRAATGVPRLDYVIDSIVTRVALRGNRRF